MIHTAYRQDGPEAWEITVDGAEHVARAAARGRRAARPPLDRRRLRRPQGDAVRRGRPAVAATSTAARRRRPRRACRGRVRGRAARAHVAHRRRARPRAVEARARCAARRASRSTRTRSAARCRSATSPRRSSSWPRSTCRARCTSRARTPSRGPSSPSSSPGGPVRAAPAPPGRPLDCSLDSSRAAALLRTRLRGVRELFASRARASDGRMIKPIYCSSERQILILRCARASAWPRPHRHLGRRSARSSATPRLAVPLREQVAAPRARLGGSCVAVDGELVDVLVLWTSLSRRSPEVVDAAPSGRSLPTSARVVSERRIWPPCPPTRSRGADDVQPEVALVADRRLAGVQAHPDADLGALAARRGRGARAARRRRRDGVARPGEGEEERVALRVDLGAAGPPNVLAHDAAVLAGRPRRSRRRAAAASVVEPSMSREDERDGAGRAGVGMTGDASRSAAVRVTARG